MPNILVNDLAAQLGVTSPYDMSFLRALTWLAKATSPSPRSRYRPASRWTVAKYSTVCDPRRRGTTHYPFTVNPGIADLDPHQKAVLSDDIGMAVALCLLDEKHGILGLADVYALCSAGSLMLKSPGRHRNMPDFLVELQTPLAGSHTVLLECKGSVKHGHHKAQLATACHAQLGNVDSVRGVSATSIPKIAAATELRLGNQLTVYIGDPPVVADPPLKDQLKANLLALEYSLFGDLVSANDIWRTYSLPAFTTSEEALRLPGQTTSVITDDAITTLGSKASFRIGATGAFEDQAVGRTGYARTHITIEMSEIAKAARQDRNWMAAIGARSVASITQVPQSVVEDAPSGNERHIVENSETSTGVTARSETLVWF